MKKLLLLIFIISVYTNLGAQGVEFIGQDEITYGDPSSPDVASYFTVKNNSDITRTLKVRRSVVDMIDGTSHWFCWVLCWQDDVDDSPFGIQLAPGEETTEFSAHFNPEGQVYENWAVEYCFYDQNDESFEFCTTVNWSTADPLSVEDIYGAELGLPQPNPSEDRVIIPINFKNTPNRSTLAIYSVVGEEVKSINLAAGINQIEFDVNDLAPGVYIYSLIADGNALNSGRLVVK